MRDLFLDLGPVVGTTTILAVSADSLGEPGPAVQPRSDQLQRVWIVCNTGRGSYCGSKML